MIDGPEAFGRFHQQVDESVDRTPLLVEVKDRHLTGQRQRLQVPVHPGAKRRHRPGDPCELLALSSNPSAWVITRQSRLPSMIASGRVRKGDQGFQQVSQ